jgi:type I restriction enzyme S subunit
MIAQALPSDWTTITILAGAEKIMDYRGRTPKKLGMNWGGGRIRAISARNVRMGHIDFTEEYYLGSENLYRRWMTHGDVERNDALITTEAPLGNVAPVPDDDRYILSQRIVLIRPRPDIIDKTYFLKVLQSPDFQRLLNFNATGSTALGIQRKRLEQLKVQVPPLPEQRRIGRAVQDVDDLIAMLERFIAKKKAVKQGMMQQLLTGQTRLPGFIDSWIDTSLDNISAFITKGSTPTTYGFKWESTGVPFLRSECVSDHGLDMAQSMCISTTANNVLRRSQVTDGDILMTITGNVGRVIQLAGVGDANINQHIARIRVKDARFDSCFVYHYLSQRAVREYYESIVTGQAYPQISLKQVRDTLIPTPPIEEQRAIAAVLSDADDEIAALQTRLDKARDIKQAMMQQLLTGRIRLLVQEAAA